MSKPFKPSDRVVWWKQDGGFVVPVLAVTEKRMKIEAEEDEGKVIRYVLPRRIEHHAPPPESERKPPGKSAAGRSKRPGSKPAADPVGVPAGPGRRDGGGPVGRNEMRESVCRRAARRLRPGFKLDHFSHGLKEFIPGGSAGHAAGGCGRLKTVSTRLINEICLVVRKRTVATSLPCIRGNHDRGSGSAFRVEAKS